MSISRFVLVTGATGRQGGALTRLLLRKGWRVRALTRDADTAQARELAQIGAELFAANTEQIEQLEHAAADVDIVFAMATPAGGVEAETRQAINIVDAGRNVGVKHIVYASVAGADKQTGIPHFESKYAVEQHLRGLDTSFTIVAPVYFMENLLAPWNVATLRSGTFAQALPPGRPLQQIAVADIARFTAEVIAHAGEFAGQRIDIGGDEVTGADAAAIVARAAGIDLEYVEVPIERARAGSEDLALMSEWFNRVGYNADLPGLRALYPQVGWRSLDQWAATQDWARILKAEA